MKSTKLIAFLLLFALFTAIALPSLALAATPGTAPSGGILTTLASFFGDWVNKILNIDWPAPSQPSTAPPSSGGKPSSSSSSGEKEVLGFFAEWWGTDTSSFDALTRQHDKIDTIAAFWGTMHSDGTITDRGGNDHASVVKYAKANQIKTLLMVNNSKENSAAHAVLSSPAVRQKAIGNIETVLKKYGLDGVNIDFESVSAKDRDQLTAFMQELSARLKPQGYSISIDVMPKHNEEADFAMAYDYAKLAQASDQIIIMTYDYHGPWGGPGAIADIASVERDIQYALKLIPKQKILLGVAGYGYDWSTKGVESLEYGAIQKLISQFGVKPQWDDTAKSAHFAYTGADGIQHQVWYENAQSLQYKLNLANRYDLAGIALWKLGEEDPASWQVIQSTFNK